MRGPVDTIGHDHAGIHCRLATNGMSRPAVPLSILKLHAQYELLDGL